MGGDGAQNQPCGSEAAQQYHVVEVTLAWLNDGAEVLQELIDAQREPSPFQSPEWLLGWWQTLAQDYQAIVLVAFCENVLVGVMPLMRRNAIWAREIEWLGAGRSDHAPILLRDGHAQGAAQALVAYLHDRVSKWDILSLRTLRESDLQAFSGVLQQKGTFVVEDVSPRLDIAGTWDDYLSSKSRKHRGNLVRAIKRLEANGDLTVTCETQFSDALLREIADVEMNSWKRTEGSLRMASSGYGFFAAILTRLAARDAVEIWVLRHRGQMLAYLVTFRYCNRIFYYNGAFREDAKERISEFPVGTTLLSLAIRSAHERKLLSFDFLRGDEPYKELWTGTKPQLFHLVLSRGTLRGIVVEWLHVRVRWWLRRSDIARKAWVSFVWLRERVRNGSA